MNEEQESFIRQVEQVGKGKVLIKVTGCEGVDLAPHSHHCIQVVETIAGSPRVTVGAREYFVPEGYTCWIPSGMMHALASNNRKINLRIFYFLKKPPFETLYTKHSN